MLQNIQTCVLHPIRMAANWMNISLLGITSFAHHYIVDKLCACVTQPITHYLSIAIAQSIPEAFCNISSHESAILHAHFQQCKDGARNAYGGECYLFFWPIDIFGKSRFGRHRHFLVVVTKEGFIHWTKTKEFATGQ